MTGGCLTAGRGVGLEGCCSERLSVLILALESLELEEAEHEPLVLGRDELDEERE